ncbi:alpha/beta fold hydrolase [Kribbella deserti]|uniref:Alpha/beta fold hydrolase n=1 Tax=Kribbella deserti TaxID=1926257 RepID=A0ABV6QTJ0_9ACTN
MNTTTSTDGTTIAYDRIGQGPALVLIDGALCSRAQGPMPELAQELQNDFTVYTYDRRGRADSGTPSRTRWTGRSRTSRP